MSEDQSSKDLGENENPVIKFKYVESKQFRSFHADGVVGGVSPQLNIQVGFYTERTPIPQERVFKLDSNGNLTSEITEKRVIEQALLREVEANVILDVETAEMLIDWLQDQIEEIRTFLDDENSKI